MSYAEKYLLPELNEFVVDAGAPNPNSFLVLDNVAMHHDPRFLALLQAKGVRYQHLSQYSPDMSPIEPAFGQVKAYLRRHYKPGPQNTQRIFLHGLAQVQEVQATAYFRHCNYPRTAEIDASDATGEEEVVAAVLALLAARSKRE